VGECVGVRCGRARESASVHECEREQGWRENAWSSAHAEASTHVPAQLRARGRRASRASATARLAWPRAHALQTPAMPASLACEPLCLPLAFGVPSRSRRAFGVPSLSVRSARGTTCGAQTSARRGGTAMRVSGGNQGPPSAGGAARGRSAAMREADAGAYTLASAGAAAREGGLRGFALSDAACVLVKLVKAQSGWKMGGRTSRITPRAGGV
jgi:hypothetical protein